MNTDIHLGDIGTVMIATIKDGDAIVDVSSATTKSLIFRKPDGVVVTKPAVFSTDGADGQIQYTADAAFFDQANKWRMQALIVMPSGTWKSDAITFNVADNL